MPQGSRPTPEPDAYRIMVYSHDAFGLGNLRRMLAICQHLLAHIPRLSILLVSGSPMIHEFRLPKGLDYIKLPCLNRGTSGELSAKYLGTSLEETVALRSHLIQLAAAHFKPNLLLVDKKPTGLHGELSATLSDLHTKRPSSKCILLLRDILDKPEKIVGEWIRRRYYATIQTYYDQILVVGMQSVFDLVREYKLPPSAACKVRYCGYIRKPLVTQERVTPIALDYTGDRTENRTEDCTERRVVVTPGGGEDGYSLVSHYLSGLKALAEPTFHSRIVCGPAMPADQQQQLKQLATSCRKVAFQSFTSQSLSYLQSADVVVSMGGYNTLSEALSFHKSVVAMPRTHPSQEQLIRATRFAQKNWVKMIHPERANGRSLMQAVLSQLANPLPPPVDIDFNGLPQIAQHISQLMPSIQPQTSAQIGLPA